MEELKDYYPEFKEYEPFCRFQGCVHIKEPDCAVKDALKKKEVITFNEKDEPVVLDPLFEYWICRYYFEIAE